MIKRWVLLIILVTFVLPSCSWLGHKKVVPAQTSSFVQAGKIVDAQRLRQGGAIFIQPFIAGPNVEVNSKLDKISLMMMKGLADGLMQDEHKTFQILTADKADDPDFIVKGHILDVHKPAKVKKWVMRNRQISLSVQGRMIDTETGETIVVFDNTRTSQQASQTHEQLGYALGQDIARFVLDGMNE